MDGKLISSGRSPSPLRSVNEANRAMTFRKRTNLRHRLEERSGGCVFNKKLERMLRSALATGHEPMSSLRHHLWVGDSGTRYKYFIRDWPARLAPVPGNFILARVAEGNWQPILVGECDDLSVIERVKLVRWSLDQHGVTHVHSRPNLGAASERGREVGDLVARWKPPANGRQY